MNDWILPTVSVCCSTTVALLSVLVPLVLSLLKFNQELAISRMSQIDEKAQELLSICSILRHWELPDLEKAFGGNAVKAWSKIDRSYYHWELTITDDRFLNDDDRKEIEDLRSDVQKAHNLESFRKLYPTLIETTFRLTKAAKSNILQATLLYKIRTLYHRFRTFFLG
jgi:hypothetical protein